MVVPELRCPMTPFTLASTSFCATMVAVLASAWSSSLSNSKRTFLPPMLTPLALASSIAMRVPFSLSLPMCACGPVRGEDAPIFTTSSAAASESAAGFSDLPHAESIAAHNAARSNNVFLCSIGRLLHWKKDAELSAAPLCLSIYKPLGADPLLSRRHPPARLLTHQERKAGESRPFFQ